MSGAGEERGSADGPRSGVAARADRILYPSTGELLLWSAVLLVVVLHLFELGAAPQGVYLDEASVGYNAWSIAHFGIDEHGHSFPLFFEDFQDWKGPVATYMVAPFTLLFGLHTWVVRLPGALLSIGVALLAGRITLRLGGSRGLAALLILLVGVEPWTFLMGRTALEGNIHYVFFLLLALAALVEGGEHPRARHLLVAGFSLAIFLYTYTPARVLALVMALAIWVVFRLRGARMAALLGPVLAAYALLAVWGMQHPGALGARFSGVSIGGDGAGPLTLAGRVIAAYAQYLGFPVLFSQGDPNPRHSTGFGGVLLITTLPVILVGIAHCVRHRRERLPQIVLVALLLGPVPAAARAGTSVLGAAALVPPIVVLMAYGWIDLRPLLVGRKAASLAVMAALLLAAGPYLADFFTAYPLRSAPFFRAGDGPALLLARQEAGGGHLVYVSNDDGSEYIEVLYWLQVDPREYVSKGLRGAAGFVILDDPSQAAQAGSGDILVLRPADPVPAGAQLIASETTPFPGSPYDNGPPPTLVLADVYQR